MYKIKKFNSSYSENVAGDRYFLIDADGNIYCHFENGGFYYDLDSLVNDLINSYFSFDKVNFMDMIKHQENSSLKEIIENSEEIYELTSLIISEQTHPELCI